MVGGNKLFKIFANTILVLLSLFCLIPIALLVVSSITEESSLIANGYSFIPGDVSFLAYKYLLTDSTSVIRGYGISAFVTIVGTTINVIMTIFIAYPLSRKDLPGRNIITFFIFFTMLFSGGLVPTYTMWTQTFNIKNTIFAYIVPGLLLNPFNIIMARTYFTINIPESIIEAARIDGANELTTLNKVVLPMSLPIVATISLLVALGYWNDWMNGLYYVTDENMFSIQVLLNKMLMDVQFLQSSAAVGLSSELVSKLPSTGLKMAVAVLGALPMLIAYPFFQNYFVKGITVGAVKE